MRISWKEILAIIILALLAISLSLFYGKDAVSGCGIPLSKGVFCDAYYIQRGFPKAFLFTGNWKNFLPGNFIFDLMFYFLIIGFFGLVLSITEKCQNNEGAWKRSRGKGAVLDIHCDLANQGHWWAHLAQPANAHCEHSPADKWDFKLRSTTMI